MSRDGNRYHGRDLEVSVLIPVRNGAETLPIQLEALVRQVDAPPFEVVVADNGSTDSTRQVAETFLPRLNMRVIDASRRRGPSYARNMAAAAARSSNLLFCDADDRVAPGWVAALRRGLAGHGIVTGPVIYVDRLLHGDERPPLPRKMPARPRLYFGQIPFAGTGNLGVRADLMEDLGGFDCALRCCQDADFTVRAHLTGRELFWVDDAVLFCRRRRSLAGAIRQFFRYGYYDVLVYKKLRPLGFPRRPVAAMLRPYLTSMATPYRLLISNRRWSWLVNTSQLAGRLVGSVRHRIFCP